MIDFAEQRNHPVQPHLVQRVAGLRAHHRLGAVGDADARLGLDYTAANTLETADGKLSGRVLGDIVDAQGKADWLARVRDELGMDAHQVVAIGDGANDLKMLAQAGVSIAYHAKPVVRGQASYALNRVGLEGVIPLLGGVRPC